MPEATSRPVNPLVLKSVKCPLCGTTARQGRLKSSLFVPGPPDFDLRPHGYRRQAPGLEAVHPSAHFLWYCPGCHHAADPARFQDPAAQTGLTLAHFREAFLAHTQGEGPGRRVTLRLAEGLGEGPRDFLAAARVYLLAANQLQAIPEVAQREARVLGRYLVRYAWLLRDLGETPGAGEGFWTPYTALVKEVRADWRLLPVDETIALKLAAHYFAIAHQRSALLQGEVEALQLLLLIARLHLQLGQLGQARESWRQAASLARKREASLRDQQARALAASRQPRKPGAAAPAGSDPGQLATLEAEVVLMKNQVAQVAELITDARLEEDITPVPAAGAEVVANLEGEAGKPARKKRFGIF